MGKVEIRVATIDDLTKFWGHPPVCSMWAFVAMLDDEPIAVAGVLRSSYLVAFSEMKEAMRGRKKDIVRMACANMNAIRSRNLPVIALANKDEPTAESLMKHLGFVYLGSTPNGEVFSWQQQSQ